MDRLTALLLVLILVAAVASGCGGESSPTAGAEAAAPTSAPPTPAQAPMATSEEGGEAMPFELTSPAFAAGQSIPSRHTCDGDDISPPLAWTDPPAGTQSLALICDDPDAPVGTWVHWVLYDLPPDTRSLPEAVPSDANLPDGGRHGENGWRRLGYGGPCPPSGTHRYFFKLYALDTVLGLDAGASKKQVLQAVDGHILAQVELMGTYSRQ